MRRLEIQYTALSLVVPENVRFRYKLEGLDDEWVDAGARRAATFTKLPAGPYRFHVVACNNDGVWNELGAALPLRVLPHFWQTTSFRAAVLVGLGGLAFGLYHWRVSELKRRQALQQEFSSRLIESQEQERKRIAGELHDSLGQDLLVIKNRLLLNAESEGISTEAKDDLRDVSDIASHAIGNVREIAQNLRPHLLDHLGLTRAIQDTVKKIARSGAIQFDDAIGDVDRCLAPEFEINFFRIVQEVLNNIVKHSGATTVQFRLARDPSCLHLTVQDNGTGFDPRQVPAAKSFGLSGLAERVRIMGGQFEVLSQPGSGTTVRIEVPLTHCSPSGPGKKHERTH